MADFRVAAKLSISLTATVAEVALVDFTGDNRADLVLTEKDNPTQNITHPVRVFATNGAGAFTETQIAGGAPLTVYAKQTLVADFNQDGRQDVYFADHGYDAGTFPGYQSSLLLSKAGGGFTNATLNLPQQYGFNHSTATADIDLDGDLDIVAGNANPVAPPMVLVNSNGVFTAKAGALPGVVLSAPGYAYAFLDVNGDRAPDLFAASSNAGPSRVLLNDGKGNFRDSGSVLPTKAAGVEFVDAQTVDLNKDGRMDLLVSGYSKATFAGTYTQALIQQADGTFTDETATRIPGNDLGTTYYRERVILTDINNDGQMDAVVQYNGPGASAKPAEIWMNSRGAFTATPIKTDGLGYYRVAVGDVDANGAPDMVAVSNGQIQTLLSTGPSKIGVAIADQLSVVYLGRGISATWRDATAGVVETGASSAILKGFFDAAVADRAFGASDSLQTIVNKTFLNIFGVNASAFEQNAWANTVAIGAVTKEALPWAMFNSYLGATNVPPSYQIPAQSRIIAAHEFTNNVAGKTDATLGGPGVSTAEAARAWLLPIRSQADAAGKVLSASSTVNSLSGVAPSGGPLEAGTLDGALLTTSDPQIGIVGVAPAWV